MTREQAIRILETTPIMVIGCKPTIYEEALGTVIEELEKSTWIPCSERLPIKYGEYLCCDRCGNTIIAMPFADEESDTGYAAENDNCYMWSCIAWMPLPEPYKEEEK